MRMRALLQQRWWGPVRSRTIVCVCRLWHFALILHAAAGPSGRVSPIDSSGSRSIRTGASIPVAPPVKQKTLTSFFAANSARTVVAPYKPVVPVVASQAMDVGNRWWDEDEEVQIDDEAEKRTGNWLVLVSTITVPMYHCRPGLPKWR